MKKIRWLSIFLLITSWSCTTLHGGELKTVTFRSVPTPELWAMGDKPAYLVITEKNWPTYFSNQPKGSDFKTNIYIAASLGMKPNPGHSVKILQIQQEREKVVVRLEIGEPDPKKFYAQVIVYPRALAEVPTMNLQPFRSLTFVFLDQKGRELASIRAEI